MEEGGWVLTQKDAKRECLEVLVTCVICFSCAYLGCCVPIKNSQTMETRAYEDSEFTPAPTPTPLKEKEKSSLYSIRNHFIFFLVWEWKLPLQWIGCHLVAIGECGTMQLTTEKAVPLG